MTTPAFAPPAAADHEALVEPLFRLPATLPPTAWAGHIPFLFVLFRAMRPATYVDLGVYLGASLIAAASAARDAETSTRLWGVDTWQGDEHAGFFQGDAIFEHLKSTLDGHFPDVTLLRCLFDDAREQFAPGSVDLLHIDGLHTYDAVRHDFDTWRDRMAPDGVVMFHDICVHERDFGVHRLWAELKASHATLEFHHSHGLGVLFLDPSGPRFDALRPLLDDPAAMEGYRALAALIGGTLQPRMDATRPDEKTRRLEFNLSEMTGRAAAWQAVAEARERRLADAEDALAQRIKAHEEALAQLDAQTAAERDRPAAPLRALARLLGR